MYVLTYVDISIFFIQLTPGFSWTFHGPGVPFCGAVAVAAVAGRSGPLPQDARRCGRTGSLTLDQVDSKGQNPPRTFTQDCGTLANLGATTLRGLPNKTSDLDFL